MLEKTHRSPWTEEKFAVLKKWWPHFGTRGVFDLNLIPGLSRSQIISKAYIWGLKMLPKQERLCAECKTNKQYSRRGGLKCRLCHLKSRKDYRNKSVRTLPQFIRDSLRSFKYRDGDSNLDFEYLMSLWSKQEGKCFYSGFSMQDMIGHGRGPLTPSLDRIEPKKGYVKGNVVWCCLACNIGKWIMSQLEYVSLCDAVAKRHKDVLFNNSTKLFSNHLYSSFKKVDRMSLDRVVNRLLEYMRANKEKHMRSREIANVLSLNENDVQCALKKGRKLKMFDKTGSGQHIFWHLL